MKLRNKPNINWNLVIGALQVLLLAALIVYVGGLNRELEKMSARLSRVTTAVPEGPAKVVLPPDTDAPVMGADTARVELVVFSDFQCTYCKTFARETLPRLKRDYVDKGLLRISFRHLPLDIHDKAFAAAEASACANEQGQFWPLHDAFFDNPDALGKDFFTRLARQQGMDMDRFNACLQSRRHRTTVEKDMDAAHGVGINGTPAIIINGNVTLGSRPYPYFTEAIDKELGR